MYLFKPRSVDFFSCCYLNRSQTYSDGVSISEVTKPYICVYEHNAYQLLFVTSSSFVLVVLFSSKIPNEQGDNSTSRLQDVFGGVPLLTQP